MTGYSKSRFLFATSQLVWSVKTCHSISLSASRHIYTPSRSLRSASESFCDVSGPQGQCNKATLNLTVYPWQWWPLPAPLESGDSSVVRAPDSWSKGSGFETPPKRRENVFFSRANFLFCAGGRLYLNTQAPYLCGFEWNNTINWCMVVWCALNLSWDGSSFTWHQPCNKQIALSVHHLSGY